MNNVNLIGRLTRDPELRVTTNMKSVGNFTLAVQRNFDKEKTDFFKVVVWGKTAENLAEYIVKGNKIAVSGEIQTGSYKDKNDVTHYTTEVVGNRVEFLEWGTKKDEDLPKGFMEVDDDDVPF